MSRHCGDLLQGYLFLSTGEEHTVVYMLKDFTQCSLGTHWIDAVRFDFNFYPNFFPPMHLKIFIFSFIYVYICVHATYVQVPEEAKKEQCIIWTWSYRKL